MPKVTDPFLTKDVGITGPATYAAAVTASDTTVFDAPSRGLFVGTAGNLAVRMLGAGGGANGAGDGGTVTFTGVIAGQFLPIRVDKVLSTGTTASNIVLVW